MLLKSLARISSIRSNSLEEREYSTSEYLRAVSDVLATLCTLGLRKMFITWPNAALRDSFGSFVLKCRVAPYLGIRYIERLNSI